MGGVTRILADLERGDPDAAEQLLPLVYDELRRLASARMGRERPGQTLQATDLVHEAYLHLVDVEQAQNWNSRGHFFGACVEAMRRILVERARRKGRIRHGGRYQRIELPDDLSAGMPVADTILLVDDVLEQLASENPKAAEVVKMHFLAGLTLDEVAEALGMSRATAYRKWKYARARVRLAMSEAEGRGESAAADD